MGLFEHGIFERKPNPTMLTDTKLRNLKPRDKLYKVNDREGLYVGVASENGIYGHSRFCNTDFDDKLACLNLSGV